MTSLLSSASPKYTWVALSNWKAVGVFFQQISMEFVSLGNGSFQRIVKYVFWWIVKHLPIMYRMEEYGFPTNVLF